MQDEVRPNRVPDDAADPNTDVKDQITDVLSRISSIIGLDTADKEADAALRTVINSVLQGDKDTPGLIPRTDKLTAQFAKADEDLKALTAQNRQQEIHLSILEGKVGGLSAEINGLRSQIASLAARPAGLSAREESDRRNISYDRDYLNDGRTRGGR